MALAKCRFFCRALPLVLFFSTLVVGTGATSADAITASQIVATANQIATLEQTIIQEQQQSALLDQQYLAALAEVARLQSQLATTQQRLSVAQSRVKTARDRLAKDAVNAYVNNQPVSGLDTVFSNATSADVAARNQFARVAFGNIAADVHALATEQHKLNATSTIQQNEERQAAQAADQLQALQLANEQAAAAVATTLTQVQGTLGNQVAQYAVQQARAEAAYATANTANASSAAQAATADASVAVALNAAAAAEAAAAANEAATAAGAPRVGSANTLINTGVGGQAVAAAESQLGVPYLWGGETPGVGFDCSGLTQWAWGQAGVSIPRIAADQATAIPSVALTQLEPGDLLFYYNLDGDHKIDHVVLYLGFGPYGSQTIIQAPYTGASVQLAPLFTQGLIGAGRP